MAGMVPAIHVFFCCFLMPLCIDVDGRDFRREEALRAFRPAMTVVRVVFSYFFADVLVLLRGSSAGLT